MDSDFDERCRRILEIATILFEGEPAAIVWLNQASDALGSVTPESLFATNSGFERVLSEIGSIEHGIPNLGQHSNSDHRLQSELWSGLTLQTEAPLVRSLQDGLDLYNTLALDCVSRRLTRNRAGMVRLINPANPIPSFLRAKRIRTPSGLGTTERLSDILLICDRRESNAKVRPSLFPL